ALVLVLVFRGRGERGAPPPTVASGEYRVSHRAATRDLPPVAPESTASDGTLPVRAQLESVTGEVAFTDGPATAPARAGQLLATGHGLSVGRDASRAVLDVEGAGRLFLGAATTVNAPSAAAIEDQGAALTAGAVAIPFMQGRLHADLQPRPAGV